jgi:GntR family transcriptional regulator, transcriptional repressor for pyruvate dehydrogenase complex
MMPARRPARSPETANSAPQTMPERPEDLDRPVSADGTERRFSATPVRTSRRRAKISQVLATEIVRDIVESGLQEGDQLPTEAEMVEEFDVGRASLREALRLLESYGLITIRQGQRGGPIVGAIRPADVGRMLSFYLHMTGATYGELLEARLVIEPVMARLAAERQDPTTMQQLREVMEREQAASFEEPEYLRSADAFHFIVSGMSGNRVLDLLGRGLRAMYQERIHSGALLPRYARSASRRLHREIGEAILAGQGELAARLMESHLQSLASMQYERTPNLRGDRIAWDH